MTTIGHYTIPTHHIAPVCPPDQNAECLCGYALADHDHPMLDGSVPDLGSYCPVESGLFTLLAGDTLDCEHITECTICEIEVCTEHSNEFTTCAGGEGLHHLDCRFACASCTACARDERGA